MYVTASVVWLARNIKSVTYAFLQLKASALAMAALLFRPVTGSAPTLHTPFPVPTRHRTKIH